MGKLVRQWITKIKCHPYNFNQNVMTLLYAKCHNIPEGSLLHLPENSFVYSHIIWKGNL